MDAEENANPENKENDEQMVANQEGGVRDIVSQKGLEITDLKREVLSLEAELVDLRILVEEQTVKMMSEIESSEESRRRVAEINSRLEETKQELDRVNTIVSNLVEEQRMLKSVASRVGDLEIQVSRLQHDLISCMNHRDEISAELQEMRDSFKAMQRAAKAKDSMIKGLEDETNSLKGQISENDQKLEILVGELERCLLDSESKLVEEKQALEKAERMLKSLESKTKFQEEKIKTLELQLKQTETEAHTASHTCDQKQLKIGELSRELDELRTQLEKSMNDKRLLEEQYKWEELKLREENQVVRKKLDVQVEGSRLKESEIVTLEKAFHELSSRLEAIQLERKTLIDRFDRSEKGIKKGTPDQEASWRLLWVVAAASTGTFAAVATIMYIKYSKQR